MTRDMIDIQKLMPVLGYSDPRSVKKWCKQRRIPIISFGLKKYILLQYLTQYIENQCVIFAEKITSAISISKIIVNIEDNKETKTDIEDKGKKQEQSESVKKLLSKIKTNDKGT